MPNDVLVEILQKLNNIEARLRALEAQELPGISIPGGVKFTIPATGTAALREITPVALDPTFYASFDGPAPFKTDYTGIATGQRGQVATVTGGVIYRPGKFQKAVQLAEATTNLVKNPSFEVGISTWSGFNGVSVGTESDAVFGAQCLYVARNGAGNQFVVTDTMSVGSALTGRTFTVSFWWRAQSAGLVTQSDILLMDGGFGNQKILVFSGTSIPTTWTKRTATVTFTGTVSSTSLRLALRPSTTNSAKILYDAVQVEEKAYVTPYCDGSLGTGHSWSGTAHASTSNRTVSYLDYPTPIAGDIGTVMGWIRFDRVRSSAPASIEYELMAECNYGSGGFFVGLQHNTSGTRQIAAYGLSSALTLGSSWTPPAGQWLFVALTWDGTTVTLYGGREDGDFTSATQAQSASRTFGTDTFTVGRWSGVGGPLNGLLDDLVILSRAADADEIRAIYESNAPIHLSAHGLDPRLIGDYKLTVPAAGTAALLATVNAFTTGQSIDQSSTTAAIPVLILDQGDVDQDFIELIGGSSTGNATSISTDAAGAFAGRMQITVNGIRRWINFYADA